MADLYVKSAIVASQSRCEVRTEGDGVPCPATSVISPTGDPRTSKRQNSGDHLCRRATPTIKHPPLVNQLHLPQKSRRLFRPTEYLLGVSQCQTILNTGNGHEAIPPFFLQLMARGTFFNCLPTR